MRYTRLLRGVYPRAARSADPWARNDAGEIGAIIAKTLRRLLRWAGAAGLGLGLAAALGLAWFATPPAPEAGAQATDAIVVLTGGSMRLNSGIDLLREGRGRALFVSGVNPEVDLGQLLRVSGNGERQLECCIAIGHEAANTRGNARETAAWMQRNHYHSLRLVTAWYHMPRSLLEFERAMPDVGIVAHPIFPDRVKTDHWWVWHGTAGLLLIEYGKYLAALFRPLVARGDAPPAMPVEAGLAQ